MAYTGLLTPNGGPSPIPFFNVIRSVNILTSSTVRGRGAERLAKVISGTAAPPRVGHFWWENLVGNKLPVCLPNYFLDMLEVLFQ